MIPLLLALTLSAATAALDPLADPGGYLSQFLAALHACWPLAIGLGLYGVLEMTLKFGDADGSPIKAWLDKGRRTLVLSGAVAVLGAVLDVIEGGGALYPALLAGIAALSVYWHPAAKEVAGPPKAVVVKMPGTASGEIQKGS